MSESEVFQKKNFLFSLVLFLKLESSAVSFKFPKFGRQLPPFMGVVTFLGTALRSGGSCQGKQTKEVESRAPPKERFISGQGNKSDLRPKTSSWRTSEETERDKTCDKNGGFWRRFFRMEILLLIFFTLGSNKNDQTPRHNQLRVPLSHTHALPIHNEP